MSYASVWDAIEYTPSAEGEPEIRIQAVLNDASRIVARMAPPLVPREMLLSEAVDDVATTFAVGYVRATDPLSLRRLSTTLRDFPESGILRIEDEHVAYAYLDLDRIEFQGLTRGYGVTTAASHAVDASVFDISYDYAARDAELRVFDYLWVTKGNSLTSTSFLGASVAYEGQSFIKKIVVEVMGRYALASHAVNISHPSSSYRGYGPLTRY